MRGSGAGEEDLPAVLERTEVLGPGPAEAFADLLDVPAPTSDRDGLPLLWHWLYLHRWPRQRDLGPDGHPVRGVIPAPPGPGKRRMWAGGRVRHLAPVRLEVATTRRTELVSSVTRTGRSGPLTIVVVRHELTQCGVPVVVEEQDIVYRDAVAPSLTSEPTDAVPESFGDESETVAGTVAERDWSIRADPTLLFRFSALTANAHRIHYDRDYARDVEGYPDLVVHGPLQALAMAEAVRAQGAAGPLSIDYRLVSPLTAAQGMRVSAQEGALPEGDGWAVSVRDRSGRTTARASITRLPH